MDGSHLLRRREYSSWWEKDRISRIVDLLPSDVANQLYWAPCRPKYSDTAKHHQTATRICCAPKDLRLWPHNQTRRVRAGKVCDTGGSAWETRYCKGGWSSFLLGTRKKKKTVSNIKYFLELNYNQANTKEDQECSFTDTSIAAVCKCQMWRSWWKLGEVHPVMSAQDAVNRHESTHTARRAAIV